MRILFTGGGTGGHINPAIAIANTIRKQDPEAVIAFVGTSRGLENKLVPKEGYELYHVEIRGLRRSLSLSNLKTLYLTVKSVSDGKKLIREFKPDIVVGTGGYVCWPVVKAASKMGIPTVLHESNAVPGVAVRMLESAVDRIYVNFEETISCLKEKNRTKTVRVGNPLKPDYTVIDHGFARQKLGIEGKYRRFLLSFGGSLGAERVNTEALKLMRDYFAAHPDCLHVHATGALEYEEAKKQFEAYGLDKLPNVKLVEYIYDMPIQMAAADLVICRAGAMTLSELAVMRKPSILIPSPNVTNNHQYKNAHVLEEHGAAVLIEEKDLGDGVLTKAVEELFGDRERLAALSENVAKFAQINAGEIIVEGLKALVGKQDALS